MVAAWAGGAELKLTFRPDEVYRAPTDDGAAIALGRYHPRGGRKFAEPVILAHGLGTNRFNLDFDEQYSVARHLARRGFEAWVLELRGRGLAGPAGEFTFDDQAEHDVRAALRVVRSAGAAKVAWVGHSKGGLAIYAHLARNPEAAVSAVATLGSPVSFRFQPGLQRFVKTMGTVLNAKVLPTARLGHLAPFGALPGPVTPYLLNTDNMEPLVVKRAMANLASDIAGGVARQFAHWVETDRFCSADGAVDYRKEMAGARTPLLVMAGVKDRMAPPPAVLMAKALWGGPVETVIAGRESGFQHDYGHADLVLGRQAPTEVFNRLGEFLERHCQPV